MVSSHRPWFEATDIEMAGRAARASADAARPVSSTAAHATRATKANGRPRLVSRPPAAVAVAGSEFFRATAAITLRIPAFHLAEVRVVTVVAIDDWSGASLSAGSHEF